MVEVDERRDCGYHWIVVVVVVDIGGPALAHMLSRTCLRPLCPPREHTGLSYGRSTRQSVLSYLSSRFSHLYVFLVN